jgi:hypothetical protein
MTHSGHQPLPNFPGCRLETDKDFFSIKKKSGLPQRKIQTVSKFTADKAAIGRTPTAPHVPSIALASSERKTHFGVRQSNPCELRIWREHQKERVIS